MRAGVRFDVIVVASQGDSLVQFRGHLLREIRATGRSVLALAPGLSSAAQAWLDEEGIAYREAPLSRTGRDPFADLRTLVWLVQQIRTARPSVLLAYTVKPVVYGMLASRFVRVRRYALITGLGYAFTDGVGDRRATRLIVSALYRLALSCADKVFFQNPDDEAFFRRSALLSPRVPSVVLAGSGIDVGEFALAPPREGGVIFLLIARLLGDKGVREFVEAIRTVRRRDPTVVGRLVGWIDSNPDAIAQDELDSWVKSGDVEYLGRLQDVRPAIADATVYVLPSYREGTPRTVLEAMAMGRAIITTDAPGCRETVVHGLNGFLVPTKSAIELAAAMQRFVDDPRLAVEMGRESRTLAQLKYDVKLVSARMLEEMQLTERPS